MATTSLLKPLRREISLEVLSGKPRPFIVTLYPEGTLGFREKRQRKELLLDLRSAYLLAAHKTALARTAHTNMTRPRRPGLHRRLVRR